MSIPRYRRPPVGERVALLFVEEDSDQHTALFEAWRQHIQHDYPKPQHKNEWLLEVEEKNGIPQFGDIRPRLKILHQFLQSDKDRGFVLRCPAEKFSLHLLTPTDDERSYEDLREEFLKRSKEWMDHFKITKINSLALIYVNKLNANTLPDFYSENQLALDQVLTIFTEIPGEHECLIPPLEYKATLRLSEPPGAEFQIILKDHPLLYLQLQVQVKMDHLRADTENIANIMDLCHKKLVERFELLFTKAARDSFEPIPQE